MELSLSLNVRGLAWFRPEPSDSGGTIYRVDAPYLLPSQETKV